MPPKRRSQGEAPPVSSSPLRSRRQIKPTSCAQPISRARERNNREPSEAAGAIVSEANVDANEPRNIPPPPTRHDLHELPQRPSNSLGAAVNAGITGRGSDNSRAAQQAREDHQRQLDRQRTAAERYRAKKSKEQEEWEEQVRLFGLEEARRRHLEELEVARNQDIIPTSELEELELADEQTDPQITVSAMLRVDKKHTWETNYSECRCSVFEVLSLEKDLECAIEARHGEEQGWQIKSIVAAVRSRHSRATRKQQTMEDLSEVEWSKVTSLAVTEAELYKPSLTITITINVEADKEAVKAWRKRQREDSSDAQNLETQEFEDAETTPRPPRRTNHLLNQAQIRQDVAEELRKYNKQLTDRWLCTDQRCVNCSKSGSSQSWCFVDWRGDHYNMDASQTHKWSKALQQLDEVATLDRPPKALYDDWVDNQGPVTALSKKPLKQQQRIANQQEHVAVRNEISENKSILQQFKELNEFGMQMQMQKMTQDLMKNMAKQSKRQRRRRPSTSSSSSEERSKTRRRARHEAIPTPTPAPAPAVSTSAHRSSSPIAATPDEELEVISAFFTWKIRRVTREETKERLRMVAEIVENKAFRIKHLKAMSDLTHPMYQRAIDLSIPDGMALDFKADLELFKGELRSAQALSNMRRS